MVSPPANEGACAFIGMGAVMTGGGGEWVIECAAWRSQKGDRKKGVRRGQGEGVGVGVGRLV